MDLRRSYTKNARCRRITRYPRRARTMRKCPRLNPGKTWGSERAGGSKVSLQGQPNSLNGQSLCCNRTGAPANFQYLVTSDHAPHVPDSCSLPMFASRLTNMATTSPRSLLLRRREPDDGKSQHARPRHAEQIPEGSLYPMEGLACGV